MLASLVSIHPSGTQPKPDDWRFAGLTELLLSNYFVQSQFLSLFLRLLRRCTPRNDMEIYQSQGNVYTKN